MILADNALHVILATLFALLALLLMGVILLQRGRGTGLAGAFGGGGGAATVFGSKTGDFLTWTTVALAGIFLVYSVSLNYIFVPPPAGLSQPAPAQVPTGATAQPVPSGEPSPVAPPIEMGGPPSESGQPPAEGSSSGDGDGAGGRSSPSATPPPGG